MYSFLLFKKLNRKAFTTSTGSVCVRIAKKETFPFNPTSKIQDCPLKIKFALFIHHNGHSIIFKSNVVFLFYIIKIQFVHQSRAATSLNSYTNKTDRKSTRLNSSHVRIS